jgi:hypothetical protein
MRMIDEKKLEERLVALEAAKSWSPSVASRATRGRRWHLPGYTILNIETIGGRIIEAHLRFADQWPDLYGAGWVAAVIALYATGR